MSVLISTDTSSVINFETFKKYNISVFPLNVIIDGKEYLDGVNITQDELAVAMRGKRNIKTSTPPLGMIIEYFEELFKKGYEKIIHFTISSNLSSMFDLFTNVANNNFAGKLFIVDSYSLSAEMLSKVLFAYEKVNEGVDCEQILQLLEQRKDAYDITFIPENLTALKNGGRISPTVALIGNAMGIKPIIKFKDGGLVKDGTTRNVKRTIVDLLTANKEKFPVSDYDYTIMDFDANPVLYEYVENKVKEILGVEPIHAILPINVSAHCGPGTVGIITSKKIGNKSLADYVK